PAFWKKRTYWESGIKKSGAREFSGLFLFVRLLSRLVFSFSGLGGTRRLRRGSTGCVRAGWKKIGASTISLSTPCCAKHSLLGRNYLGDTSTLCSFLTHDRKIG